ncbi:MAG: DUF308 domain-containing protein [Bacteroidales bacterium]|nr:DUF308 domain-containing protein [Bacteroidota bacterium]MBL6950058.1 DUF308 domain-containing protein [Bacteroidales bacterium]
MEEKGKKNWWFLAVNGLISILIGIFLLFFDPDQMKVLVFYFGIIILVIGAVLLVIAIRNIKQNKHVGMLLVESILTLVIGLIMVLFPDFTLKFFLIIIGVWAVILGIAQLAILIHIKEKLNNKNILLFNALLTIVLGVLLFFDPITTAGVLLKILGAFAILFGILMIYFGFVLKALKPIEEVKSPEPEKLPDKKE